MWPWWISFYPDICSNDRSALVVSHVSCRQMAPKCIPKEDNLLITAKKLSNFALMICILRLSTTHVFWLKGCVKTLSLGQWVTFTWWKTGPKLSLATAAVNTLRSRKDGRDFVNDIFKCICLKVYFQGSNWQYSSIGSDNGLEPSRRQANIWTKYGLECTELAKGQWLSQWWWFRPLTHICVTSSQWV